MKDRWEKITGFHLINRFKIVSLSKFIVCIFTYKKCINFNKLRITDTLFSKVLSTTRKDLSSRSVINPLE